MGFNINDHVPRKGTPSLGKEQEKKFVTQEKRVASVFKGRRTKASGALSDKGDALNSHFRIECKSTDKESMILHKIWLDKIQVQAFNTGRKPCLAIQFNDMNQRWIAVKEDVFKKMFDYCYENNIDLFLE